MESITDKLNKVINEEINPALGEHLGGIILRGYEDGVASIQFTGSCTTCYAADDTLNNVVKVKICDAIPEVKDVIIDDSVSDEMLALAKEIIAKEKKNRK